MKEKEKTYLLKYIPTSLKSCTPVKIVDDYIPLGSKHPKLRLRKKGNYFEMTKKTPLNEEVTIQQEQTIKLSASEYKVFSSLKSKKLSKLRFLFSYKTGEECEIDIYQDKLKGLCIVDFEFGTEEKLKQFAPPDFCLVEINQVEELAAGKLAGKKYGDIAPVLKNFGYKKLIMGKNEKE